MKKNFLKDESSRRAFIKGVGMVGVSLGALPLLSACSKGAANSGTTAGTTQVTNNFKTGRMLFHECDPAIRVIGDLLRGASEAAQVLGLKVDELSFKLDYNLQISQIEEMAAKGNDMLLTAVVDGGLIPRMQEILQRDKILSVFQVTGLPWYTPLNAGDYYVQYQGSNVPLQAYEVCMHLFKKMGGKGKVIHVLGYSGDNGDVQRTAGFLKALKEYPDIKVVNTQPGNWSRVETKKVFEDVLATAGSFDGVFGQNDEQAIGVIGTLKERKINVPVAGLDGGKEVLDLIMSGDVYCTHSFLPTIMGGLGSVALFDAANGWKPSVPERMIYTPGILVDKDNVEKIYEIVGYKDGKTRIDWKKMSRTYNPDNWDPQMVLKAGEFWKDDQSWIDAKKPGTALPKEYDEAYAKGEFERVNKMYADHLKNRVL